MLKLQIWWLIKTIEIKLYFAKPSIEYVAKLGDN